MLPVDISYSPNPSTLAVTFAATIGDGGAISSYAWDFGDGQTSTSATPTNTYAAAGSYVVTLAATVTRNSITTVSKDTQQVNAGQSFVDTRGIPLTVTEEWRARVPGGITATPAPVNSSISPNSAVHGAADATCTITGTGFQPGSVALWGGVAKTTTFISKTSISFTAPILTASAGTVSVTVRNPDGRVSGGQNFTLS